MMMNIRLKQLLSVMISGSMVASNMVWAAQLPNLGQLTKDQQKIQDAALVSQLDASAAQSSKPVTATVTAAPLGNLIETLKAPQGVATIKPRAINLADLLGVSTAPASNQAGVFTIAVKHFPDKIDRAWLSYKVQGVDADGVVRSLNNEVALGGQLIRTQSTPKWTTVREEIRPESLRKGDNIVRFNAPAGAQYQYAVKQVALEVQHALNVKKATNSSIVLTHPSSKQYTGEQVYVRGFLKGAVASAVDNVTVNNKTVELQDGYFETTLKRDAKKSSQPWALDIRARSAKHIVAEHIVLKSVNDKASVTVANVNTVKAAQSKTFLLSSDAKTRIEHAGLRIDFPAHSSLNNMDIEARALRDMDMAVLEQGMSNVTRGQAYNGYRLLPHGAKFEKSATIRLPYDRSKLPADVQENDIRTYYFNEGSGRWVALKRIAVDTASGEIISETNHFTDFINGVIKVPDAPTSKGFAPTQMSGIKAANPAANINLMQMPQASNQGTANLNYPIDLPAGRAGMQPQLSISYNSGGGNGWMGLGWNISVPAITVDTRWGVPRYSETKESEIYLFNGQQLIRKGSAGMPHRLQTQEARVSGDTEFTLRVEGSFQKIVRKGSDPKSYTWEITSKDGTVSTYGEDDTTLSTASGHIGYWALREVRDTNDNWMRYDYEEVTPEVIGGAGTEGKELYLTDIHYTGHAGGGILGLGSDSPSYQVEFKREAKVRQDVKIDARLGFQRVTADLLRQINITYKGDAVRSYRLNYKEGPFFKQLLNEIVQHDGSDASYTAALNNESVLHRYTLDYFNEISDDEKPAADYTAYAGSIGWGTPNDSLEGDLALSLPGFEDKVSAIGGSKTKSGGVGVFIGLGLGNIKEGDVEDVSFPFTLFTKTTLPSVGVKLNASNANTEGLVSLTDMDGDGLPDKVVNAGGIKYYKNLSSPDGDNALAFSSTAISVNGPSKFSYEKSKSRSFSSQGHIKSFAMVGAAAGVSSTTGQTYFSDVNGDGLIDIVDNGTVQFNQGAVGDDFATDTIASYNANYANTPNTLLNGGTLDATTLQALVAEDAEELAKAKANAPQHDVVRVWEAPYSGVVTVDQAVVSLVDADSEEDNLDGLNVSVQHESTELWKTLLCHNEASVDNCAAKNVTQATPTGLDSVAVNAGDQIYFRVHSRENGENDQVTWNPRITYNSIDGVSGALDSANYIDANGLSSVSFQASEGVTLSQRSGEAMKMPYTGMVLLEGAYDTKADSNHVDLKVYKSSLNSNTETLVYNGENKGQINKGIQVNKDDTLRFLLDSKANINWSSVEWSMKATYTQLADTTVNLKDTKGNYQVVMDVFPEFSVTARQLQASQRLTYTNRITKIVPDVSAGSESGTLTFVIRAQGNMSPLIYDYEITNGSIAPNQAAIDTQVFNQAHLTAGINLDYYFSSEDLAEAAMNGVLKAKIFTVDAPSREVLEREIGVYAQRDAAESANRTGQSFGTMYRHWGQFIYNGANEWGTTPIDESVLGLETLQSNLSAPDENNPESGFDPKTTRFLAMTLALSSSADTDESTLAKTLVLQGGDNLTWVNSTQMSTSRLGEDDFTPPTVVPGTALAAGTVATVNRVSKARNTSQFTEYVSTSQGKVESVVDYMDLNGDRYPDIVTAGSAHFTAMHGGFEESMSSINAPGSAVRESTSQGVSFDITGTKEMDGGAKGNANKMKGENPSLGTLSGGLGNSESQSEYDYIDINGDGLSDRVNRKQGTVQLNTGYGFEASSSWNFGVINDSKGLDFSAGLGYQVDNYSFGGGVSLTRGENETLDQFTDVNGDGLVDVISSSGGVKLNTGNRFVDVNWGGGAPSKNTNVNQGTSVHVTFGIPLILPLNLHKVDPKLPPVEEFLLRLVINPSSNVSKGVSYTKNSFQDMNGDGFPEYITSSDDGELNVQLNRTGKTNMLKAVNSSFADSRIEMDYTRRGNTYNLPQNRWVLSTASVNDGVQSDRSATDADVLKQTFSYGKGYYDRREREFYGFDQVTTTSLDTLNGDAEYRQNVANYENKDYYQKGLMLSSTLQNMNGEIYTEQRNAYQLLQAQSDNTAYEGTAHIEEGASLFPALIESKKINKEQDNTKAFTLSTTLNDFNVYGDATRVTETGDSAANNMQVTLTYHNDESAYIVNKPKTIQVTELGSSELLRERTATYEDGTGNLLRVEQTIDGNRSATTDLRYTSVGNLESLTRPANDNGERMIYRYTYEDDTNTHVETITDSYDYTAEMAYDLRWGGAVTKNTDINGNSVESKYDHFGRLETITGPYELESGADYTLRFEYHPDAAVPYAITQHYDPEHPDDSMDTVTYMDGLKRVIQTKKDAAIADSAKNALNQVVVSGRVEFDGLGRAHRQHYPMVEALGQAAQFNRQYDPVAPVISEFDHIDRNVKTTLQDGTFMEQKYAINGLGHEHTSISGEINSQGSGMTATNKRYTDARGRILRVEEPNNIFAEYTYDAVNQLKEVIHSGNPSNAKTNTSVDYDLLGRRLTVTHPSTGSTIYTYDNASNLLTKKTQKLSNSDSNKEIRYQYEFERLTHILYPVLNTNSSGASAPQYDVQYYYGDKDATELNQVGRITRIVEEAVGQQRFEYGLQGEQVRHLRTISDILDINSSDPQETRWYETRMTYDSWNRIQRLTYPDGEQLDYAYDSGGLLQSLTGKKGAFDYDYIAHRNYDKFAQRRYLTMGDQSASEYQYEPIRRRLLNLTVGSQKSSESAELLKLRYGYDPMSNVVSLIDDKSSHSSKGLTGPSSQTFEYDQNMRLTEATGRISLKDVTQAGDPANFAVKDHDYSLSMGYDSLHRISNKAVTRTFDGNTQEAQSYDFSYLYEDQNKPYQMSRIENAQGNPAITPEFDDNGNMTRKEAGQGVMTMAWDDENRLLEVKNEGNEVSRYRYGHDGERVLKSTPDGQTTYVNEYLTIRSVRGADGSQAVRSRVATKHIFAGSERVATKRVDSTGTKLAESLFNKANCNASANSVIGFFVDVFMRNKTSCPNTNASDSLFTNTSAVVEEKEAYFYHSDHLGSIGIVTRDGELHDYTVFLPFGEQWIFQSTNQAANDQTANADGLNPLSPFQFTGKELDKYTGLTYFGARYYDPRTSVWLSADPIVNDYLGSSPSDLVNGGVFNSKNMNLYTYTYNNPINNTDSTGLCTEEGKDGCTVVGIRNGTSLDNEVKPDAMWDINKTAIMGDGNSRDSNFANVDLSDLGSSLQKYANDVDEDGNPTQLNTAIGKAIETGNLVFVNIEKLKASKGGRGDTKLAQKLGIGRFGVEVNGFVSADKKGNWRLRGSVKGISDKQDYPKDKNRTNLFSFGTSVLGALQNVTGGNNYWINFKGKQQIVIEGKR